MMGTRRLEAACFRVSMLEMKLNTTATVDSVGVDPVNVVPYQKTCQLRDRSLIPQKVRVRRPLCGKFHRLPVVAHIDVEIELIKADFKVDLTNARLQHPHGFDELVHRRLGAVDHFPACTPESSLLLHKHEYLLRRTRVRVDLQLRMLRDADAKQE